MGKTVTFFKKVEDLDTKFNKAIAEVLCSIGELRALIEENDQSVCGDLNGQDMKIQSIEQAMKEVNQANEKRLTTLEAQVKKLFATREPNPIPSRSKYIKIGILIRKLQEAIIEYNRG